MSVLAKLKSGLAVVKTPLLIMGEFGGAWKTVSVGMLAVLLVLFCALGLYWSNEPDVFDVRERVESGAYNRSETPVVGYYTTMTLIQVVETLLNKSGGYLTNVVIPPSIFLDNMPSWEFGVLTQARDLSIAMRKDLSRSQSQSKEDPDLAKAQSTLNFDNDSWIFPATESEYKDSIASLYLYLQRLARADRPEAQFYARADNLSRWLAYIENSLGSMSQRLSDSVGHDVYQQAIGSAPGVGSTPMAPQQATKTSWFEIDDVFFEARGTSWALLHLLKAALIDFEDILVKKNAYVSFQQIIRELEYTQATLWSPVILNGGGFGILANHSLVMANYISRANAAIIDLRELLSQG